MFVLEALPPRLEIALARRRDSRVRVLMVMMGEVVVVVVVVVVGGGVARPPAG
jgi:hypothetical protein